MNFRHRHHWLACALMVWAWLPARAVPGFGMGIGRSPSAFLKEVVLPLRLHAGQGRWLRTGLPDPSRDAPADVTAQRDAAASLRAQGFRICAILRFDPSTWKGGVRAGVGYHVPLDLREAYARGRAFAEAYAGAVDAWEIDNEPDISFVQDNPETFAAYHKALFLGLRSGAPPTEWSALDRLRQRFDPLLSPTPRVVMGGLALPPGPYFERLVENDFLSYTEGINYHYYGYAEDFTGVHQAFETAVRELSAGVSPGPGPTREFPVFITEYGYGLLSGPASLTPEGRERQRRWFEHVNAQIYALRVAAPMFFTLNTYLEVGHNEFGLLQRPATGSQRSPREEFTLSGEVPSPALRAHWDYAAAHPYHPARWSVPAPPPPSAVIVDFIPTAHATLAKTHRSYVLDGLDSSQPRQRSGSGRVLLYNFSPAVQRGALILGAGAALSGEGSAAHPRAPIPVSLAPGECRELPISVSVSARNFTLHDLEIRFEPETAGAPLAHWKTSLLPSAAGMSLATRFDFHSPDHPSAEASRAALLSRPLASEEPRLQPQGRWLVSDGVHVKEMPYLWTFEISAFPKEPLRPAMAELPLPASFRFTAGEVLSLSYRLGLPQPMDGPQRPMLDVYFRTQTGNLYQVWPRHYPRTDWQSYWQHAENFSLGFFGRVQGPWRFRDQQPVALVFFFRPTRLPASFEVGTVRTVVYQDNVP